MMKPSQPKPAPAKPTRPAPEQQAKVPGPEKRPAEDQVDLWDDVPV